MIDSYVKEDDLLYHEIFEYLVPPEIEADEEVMVKACQRNPDGLLYIGGDLGTRRSFWEPVLHSNPLNLEYVPEQAQLAFPDMIVQTFSALGSRSDLEWDEVRFPAFFGTIAMRFDSGSPQVYHFLEVFPELIQSLFSLWNGKMTRKYFACLSRIAGKSGSRDLFGVLRCAYVMRKILC